MPVINVRLFFWMCAFFHVIERKKKNEFACNLLFGQFKCGGKRFLCAKTLIPRIKSAAPPRLNWPNKRLISVRFFFQMCQKSSTLITWTEVCFISFRHFSCHQITLENCQKRPLILSFRQAFKRCCVFCSRSNRPYSSL